MKTGNLVLSILLLNYALLANAGVSKEQTEIVENAVKQVNPNFKIADATIEPVANSNLYKVISHVDSEVLYVSNEGRYFFYGDLIDLHESNKKNWNLTDQAKRIIRQSELEKFPTKKMIVFKPKHSSWVHKPIGVVTVFTDVTCPYGNRLHKEVEKAVSSGLEVRYLFFPRAGVGSDSYKKSVSVWCAKDHNKAFSMANNGETIPDRTCRHDPVESQFNFGKKIGINATPTIVLKNGTIVPGYMTSDALISLVKEADAHSGS